MAKNQPIVRIDWEGEADARTLADAAVIQSDPKRLAKAAKAAKKMVEKKAVEAKAYARLGKKSK